MLSRINLTVVLAALTLVDLAVDRVAGRLFLPAPTSTSSGVLGRGLVHLGTFVSYLAGALALFLFAAALVGVMRRRELFPRSMRFVVGVLALFFVVLLAAALSVFHLPQRLFVQLKTSHAFLSWLMALALWRAPLPLRARLGFTLFALPPILHTGALFAAEMGWHARVLLPGDVNRAGELFAFLAAGAAPLLLPSRLRGARPGVATWLLGLVAATVLGVGAWLRFDVVQMMALYGLRLDLPPPSTPGAWAYVLLLVLAVLGTVLFVVPGMLAGRGARLGACGVLLMVTSGYQISSPPELATAVCGLLALALALTREPEAPAQDLAPAEAAESAIPVT